MLTFTSIHKRALDPEAAALFTWEVGNPFPVEQSQSQLNYEIIASGKELKFIYANVQGIRSHTGDSVKWTGEDARFIIDFLGSLNAKAKARKDAEQEYSTRLQVRAGEIYRRFRETLPKEILDADEVRKLLDEYLEQYASHQHFEALRSIVYECAEEDT
jgi:hypothetical protein